MVTKRWAWLAAFALLFAGLTNAHAHVHYCFDGQEPPASVHLADSLDHHHDVGLSHGGGHDTGHDHHDHDLDHGQGGEHDDLDLDLPNQALAKTVKHDLPAITAVVRWAVADDAGSSYSTAQLVAAPPRQP